ncbi:hypothetical protein HNQ81_001587 [Desulfoprunum benzoelyticum]|uniref:Flavinylation-associated cytochrome domain-containing protein n=1 Tax=Desulfoprunum benzoelyticum TaxID=1506996 RepID=A0A840UYX7_9BACT|nr:DUF4405 domain-containing protein [Desulfoprunum benzoelyticum]MBB5347858.1 hypothetical protein [Desulfoprunum benzoelyticum]
MRKITSMTMLVSLVLLILNSIVLYVVPEGRVAYWADWRFWGLTKTEWGDQHVTIGFLFVLAGLLHLYYNWAAVISYLKNKVKEIKVFTLPFNVGLIITALVAVMTYFHVPPVGLVLDLGAHFKEAGARKYGEPPYGHAELSSLKMFTQKEGIELDTALSLMQQAGLRVSGGEETLLAVAQNNDMTPQQVYQVISPAKKPAMSVNGAAPVFPDEPKPGFGRKTLEQVCTELQLDHAVIVKGLEDKGLTIAAGTTIHEIAETNGREPMQIFEAIRAVVLGE